MRVSPRRNHPKRRGTPGPKNDSEDIATSHETIEEHSEGIFRVRKITGSSSTKPYRCPGCDQLIPTATPHVVAWLEEDIENRRHWHSACWAKRNDRRPRTERSRNSPKF